MVDLHTRQEWPGLDRLCYDELRQPRRVTRLRRHIALLQRQQVVGRRSRLLGKIQADREIRERGNRELHFVAGDGGPLGGRHSRFLGGTSDGVRNDALRQTGSGDTRGLPEYFSARMPMALRQRQNAWDDGPIPVGGPGVESPTEKNRRLACLPFIRKQHVPFRWSPSRSL